MNATSSRVAVLFPGQGSQTPGMRDLVARRSPELLERVVELVGEDPFARVEESTRFQQPAIFCASIAGWRGLTGDVRPGAAAGHSLGEMRPAPEISSTRVFGDAASRRSQTSAPDSGPRNRSTSATCGE